jgi:2-oxoisovalerate dehydrogenase E2 component (dihydrolipoyl transacylase)
VVWEQIRTSPSVRRLAREHNIDLRAVTPTGPQNRLLKEDLLEYIRVLASTPPAPKLVPEAGSSSPEERAAGAYLVQDTTISLTRKCYPRLEFLTSRFSGMC